MNDDFPYCVDIPHRIIEEALDWVDIELKKREPTYNKLGDNGREFVKAEAHMYKGVHFLEEWTIYFKDPELAMLFKLTFAAV